MEFEQFPLKKKKKWLEKLVLILARTFKDLLYLDFLIFYVKSQRISYGLHLSYQLCLSWCDLSKETADASLPCAPKIYLYGTVLPPGNIAYFSLLLIK